MGLLERMSDDVQISSAPTLLMLQVQYNGRAAIPLEQVVADFFQHLTV
ncbi:MAG: Pyocin activator protein PrtN, partial [Paraburkholderia sp.]|nr:Pyocin activator protein PrtN [Paraburkholderia sp.]